jgi:4-amino-4-deoxy-L-arabinose transferase-like glycosyltransferase
MENPQKEEQKTTESIINTEKIINSRLDKILNWVKQPSNAALVGIILLALIIRISYFILTKNQPLWWDEAEYMLKAKNIAFGIPDPSWWFGRPILFPFITAIFLKIGIGELGIRVLWMLMSVANVYMVYYLGKNLLNKRAGIIASFIMAVSYIEIFYMARLLVNLPEVFFILLALCFFINAEFLGKSKKYIWFVLPILMLGTLIRFTVGLGIMLLLLYLLVTKGFAFLKAKEWYISLGLSLIAFLPYGIYSWIRFKNPLYVILTVLSGSAGDRSAQDTPFNVFMQYIQYLPNYTHIILYSLFLAGAIILLFNLIIAIDKIRQEKSVKTNFLIFLSFIIPLIYFGFFVNHFEDRYLAMAMPFMFIIIAYGLDLIYSLIKKYIGKIIAIGFIILLLFFTGYQMYLHSDYIVKEKVESYNDLRRIGIWMKANSDINDSIISAGMPEIGYYSERAVYPHALNISAERDLIEQKNAKYIVLTNWEKSPDWTYAFFSNQSEYSLVFQSTSLYRGNQMFAAVFSVR